jgi:CRP-like cAMP-binding protein
MNALLMDQDLKKHLLQTMVPVKALTEDHLHTLMRDTQIEIVCRGQTICRRGDGDNTHIYLLSGSVNIETDGVGIEIQANDAAAHLPLAHYQPRLNTVVATDDCEIIRFDSDQLDAMLAWDQAANYIILDITGQRDLDEDADWMLTLLHSNLFYKVPPMNIRHVLSRFQSQFAHSGDVIVRQGEFGDSCYFIKEGSVSVYRADESKGKSALIAELGVGRCFGEDALVNDAPRNATVAMRENGVLMRLDRQDFYLLLKAPAVNNYSLADVEREMNAGAQLLDVRTEEEYDLAHAAGAQNMPLKILKLKSRLLDRNTHYIAYCNSGRRSNAAAHLLSEDGYNVTALRSGFEKLSLAQRTRFLNVGDEAYLEAQRKLASEPTPRSQAQ